MAWVYLYYCHENICNAWNELMDNIRRYRKGLWRHEQPQSPWE